MASTPQIQSLTAQASDSDLTLFDYALKEANQIKVDSSRQQKLAYIAAKYAEVQQFERAIALAENLSEEWSQSEALSKIAVLSWKAGQTQKSQLLLERLKAL
ncbi:MAG: hypothetical protein H7Y30_01160, partial [Pyrinomonadaceae bacterium]|nr:hypothetical protein [Pyrinomonadaceae bacterium]